MGCDCKSEPWRKVLMGSIDKLSNCVASNEHDFQRLMGNRDTLLADLQDKVDALSVDEAALNATIDGAAQLDGQLQKKVTCYPHNWVQSSEAEMKQARIRAADATRRRHAIAGCSDEAKAHEKVGHRAGVGFLYHPSNYTIRESSEAFLTPEHTRGFNCHREW